MRVAICKLLLAILCWEGGCVKKNFFSPLEKSKNVLGTTVFSPSALVEGGVLNPKKDNRHNVKE